MDECYKLRILRPSLHFALIYSGFEHVFVGEMSDGGKTVGGQHNWVRVYLLEKSGHINYKGYIDRKIYHHPANSTVSSSLLQKYCFTRLFARRIDINCGIVLIFSRT